MRTSIQTKVSLNNGLEMPIFGLGTYKTTHEDIGERAFEKAIELGYRHFDTASLYGNEALLGRVIRSSGIDRKEFFVTTKLWNDDQGFEKTLTAFEHSNKLLGIDYVDLYLIHWPVLKYRVDSWKALEKLNRDGLARSIGVSNYMHNHMLELLQHAEIAPSVNQIELHPFNYRSRKDILDLCDENNIKVTAYCPLTRGVKLNHPELLSLAQKYSKSASQILIRWGMQRGLIEIPKSARVERIQENAEVFDFEISPEDLNLIDSWDEDLAVSWDPTKAE